MKENLKIIILKDLVPTYGLTEENIKGNGKIIKWREKVNFCGKMAENM